MLRRSCLATNAGGRFESKADNQARSLGRDLLIDANIDAVHYLEQGAPESAELVLASSVNDQIRVLRRSKDHALQMHCLEPRASCTGHVCRQLSPIVKHRAILLLRRDGRSPAV